MNKLIISYDLVRKNSQYYANIIKTIKSFGEAKKIHLSSWLLLTRNTADEVSLAISKTIDLNDSIFIGTLNNYLAIGLHKNNQTGYTFIKDLWDSANYEYDNTPTRQIFHQNSNTK
ncbi:hypothetical protein [Neisseria sp. Ec49-e6-T10]|uniref:hypothetical protein n=1 Tax=Neisseria sp. Ec49-e6-T10 TaxID=3140744 RepID=UPI003EBFE400